MTFIERLVRAASPEKPACIAGDQELTYGDMSRFAEDHAREMRELKGRGNVALLLPNSLDYVQWYMTVLHAGHVVVPIGWNTTAYEVANTINRFDIGMVITRQEIIQAMENREFEHDFAYICTDTGLRGHIGGTGREIPDTGAPEDVVLMLGTSGSTQSPKKVMLTERNLLINGQDIIESLRYRPDERFLVVLPLTYAAANESQWIVSLLLGATVALYTGPLYPANLYRTIRDQRITSLTAVPSLLRVLLQSGAHQTISAPSLRTLCFGGGPSDTRTLEQASRVYRELNIVHMLSLIHI